MESLKFQEENKHYIRELEEKDNEIKSINRDLEEEREEHENYVSDTTPKMLEIDEQNRILQRSLQEIADRLEEK